MTELDFFEEIYKGCHGYVYLWTKQDKATHSYLLEPEVSKKIWNMARMLSGMRKDVYFSLGTTADPLPADLRAKQQNVTSIACLWVDIDIVDSAAHKAGNLPKSVDEAMGLLPEKYPPSIIVSSGHGLHAYWLLKEPVIINDENRAEVINTVRKLQQIIRNSAAANGWKIDATADLSRILRVPYTWNFKDPENPVLCEVIEYADLRYRYEDFASLQVETPQLLSDRKQDFERRQTDGNSFMMLSNCKFLQHCELDADTITYDEWVAALSNLARASDGPGACHELSKADHRRYNAEKTDAKIAEVLSNMSPRTCEYIQKTLRFKHCENCPVKCPSGWALANVPRAMATLRAVTTPNPETVFTPEVIGALALLQKEAPLEFQKHKARFKGHINLNDLSKIIAEERRKSFHVESSSTERISTSQGTSKAPKTTKSLIPDCPIDLRIPAGFSVDATGVCEYRERMDGDVIRNPASGVPVVLTSRLYNMDTDTEKVEICFKYYNQWRRTVQPRSTVFSSRSIVKLSDWGLNISSETAKYLVKYLQQMEAMNQDRIPLCYSVSRLGWRKHCEEFILPSNTDYRIEMDDEGDITEAMQATGELSCWYQLAGEIRKYTFARFLMAASFAAPLLGLFRQRNFLLYFWGTSGGGKTAAMKMAMSVWGNPDRMMTSFLTTKAGLERRLSLLSDFPVAINERQVAGQGRDKQDYLEYVVYMLEGGKGKGRASKTGLQKTAYWRTIGMANGEEPLTRENSVRGVKNRILEINTYPVLPDGLAKQVHQMDSYGLAGSLYIKALLANRLVAGEVWNRIWPDLSTRYTDYSPVHVDAVALITTADVLAGMWLWRMDLQTALSQAEYMGGEVFKSLSTIHEISDIDRAWDFVQNWMAANTAHFDNESYSSMQKTVSPLYGFIRGGKTHVFPNALREAMDKEGISYEKMIKEFATEKKIETSTGADGWVRNLNVVKYQGKACRVITILN